MLNERAKREQLFFLYSLKASKRHVAKLHVFECDLVQTCCDDGGGGGGGEEVEMMMEVVVVVVKRLR